MSTWISNNTAPHTRRATAVAILIITTNAGGILSTWLMIGALSGKDKHRETTIIFVAFSIAIFLTSTANLFYLRSQNIRKERIRATSERKDEPLGLGDRSAWFTYNL